MSLLVGLISVAGCSSFESRARSLDDDEVQLSPGGASLSGDARELREAGFEALQGVSRAARDEAINTPQTVTRRSLLVVLLEDLWGSGEESRRTYETVATGDRRNGLTRTTLSDGTIAVLGSCLKPGPSVLTDRTLELLARLGDVRTVEMLLHELEACAASTPPPVPGGALAAPPRLIRIARALDAVGQRNPKLARLTRERRADEPESVDGRPASCPLTGFGDKVESLRVLWEPEPFRARLRNIRDWLEQHRNIDLPSQVLWTR